MRLRCDSTSAGHACSIFLDWLGCHPGDHIAHERHDPTRHVLASWPNDGKASRGIPTYSGGSGVQPVAPTAPAPGPSPAPRQHAPRPDPYAGEITEWDLLPDA